MYQSAKCSNLYAITKTYTENVGFDRIDCVSLYRSFVWYTFPHKNALKTKRGYFGLSDGVGMEILH